MPSKPDFRRLRRPKSLAGRETTAETREIAASASLHTTFSPKGVMLVSEDDDVEEIERRVRRRMGLPAAEEELHVDPTVDELEFLVRKKLGLPKSLEEE